MSLYRSGIALMIAARSSKLAGLTFAFFLSAASAGLRFRVLVVSRAGWSRSVGERRCRRGAMRWSGWRAGLHLVGLLCWQEDRANWLKRAMTRAPAVASPRRIEAAQRPGGAPRECRESRRSNITSAS